MERGEIQMLKGLKQCMENKKREKNRKFLDEKLKEINEDRVRKGLEPFESMNMMFFGNERAPMYDVSEKERQALIKQFESQER